MTIRISSTKGKVSSKVIFTPNHSAKPVTSNPEANAMPPKRKMIPQGICTASFQLIIRFPFLPAPNVNSVIPNIMAKMMSSIPGKIFLSRNEREIQQSAVMINTESTIFSSCFMGPNSTMSF